jgi:hypothetical protein
MLCQRSSANFLKILLWVLLELGHSFGSGFAGFSLDEVNE